MTHSFSFPLFLSLSVLATGLSGCSWLKDKEPPPLPGNRISVLELQKAIEPSDPALLGEGFVAPSAWKNDFWTQPGGYPNHAMQHVALNPNALKKSWSADVGEGSQEKLPLTAQPVVFDGMIYTLDTESRVTAFDAKRGKRIWQNTIRPPKEDGDVISGGLAIRAGVLYATNGYNELLAINPKTGGIFWRVRLTAPSRAAPTVIGDTVLILTLDNHLAAIDATKGKILWTHEGYNDKAGLIQSASPAVDGNLVVVPLSSGELTALSLDTGAEGWTDYLAPTMQSSGSLAIPHIAALPVIDKGRVFAISYGGKMVSIDAMTGQRLWSRDIGGAKSPWVAGNMIFLISSNNELVALGKDTGAIAWVRPLSYFDESSSSNSLRWQGPILAGGRLIMTTGSDMLVEINPETGDMIRKLKLGVHVAVPPVIAGGVLYLLGDDGTLMAWQ